MLSHAPRSTHTNLTWSRGISGLTVNQSVNGARFNINQQKIRGVNLKIARFIWFSHHHHRCDVRGRMKIGYGSFLAKQFRTKGEKAKGIHVSGTAIIFKIHTEIMGKQIDLVGSNSIGEQFELELCWKVAKGRPQSHRIAPHL